MTNYIKKKPSPLFSPATHQTLYNLSIKAFAFIDIINLDKDYYNLKTKEYYFRHSLYMKHKNEIERLVCDKVG